MKKNANYSKNIRQFLDLEEESLNQVMDYEQFFVGPKITVRAKICNMKLRNHRPDSRFPKNRKLHV